MSSVTRIVVGVGLVAATVISGGGTAGGLAAYLAGSVGASAAFSLGLSLALGGLSESLAGRPKVPQPVITGNVRGSSETHLIVFGERRVGGKLVSLGTTGDNNRTLYIGLAHSVCHAGGCEGLQGFWFNDEFVPLANLGSLTGSTDVSFGDLTGQVNLAFYRGTDTQLADPQSVASGVDVTTDYRRRICWTRAILRMSTNADTFNAAFPAGIPTLNAVLRGWRCYDPRLDSTAGGSGSQRANNPLTWTWTRNPALCAATYYIAAVQDGGCGEPIDAVNWTSVAVAANICDENLTTPAGALPRYRCDIVLDTADSRAENLQKILDCMGGSAPWVGRERKFYAAAYRSPTTTIDGTWLRDELSCTPTQQIDSIVNTLYAGFPDETQGFKQVDTPKFVLASALAVDGEELLGRVSYDGVTNPYRAQYLSQVFLKRQRRQETLELPVNLKGLNVESEENVTLVLPELGINGVYRVQQWRWDDGFPKLRLKADAAADYTPETFTVPPTPGVVVTGGTTPIGTPQTLTATSITGAVALDWRSPAGTRVADPLIPVYLVERTFEDENTWAEIARTPTFSYVDSTVTATDTFDYRIRAVNTRGQSGPASNVATAGALQASGPIATAVQNPGFEQSGQGWLFGTGWDAVQRTYTGGGRGGSVVNPARNGLWTGRHTGSVSTALNTGYVAVVPGNRITAQAWFYRDDPLVSGSGFVRLNWYNAAGAFLSSVNGSTATGSVSGGGAIQVSSWTPSTLSLAVVPAGTAFARIELSATGVIRVDDVSLAVSQISNLDDVPDSATYARINADQLTAGGHKLTVAGSGVRVADGRNLPAVRHGNLGAQWIGLDVDASWDTSSPANVTITVSAATLQIGSVSSSFAASSLSTTQNRIITRTYRLYYEGSNVMNGGTFTLQQTNALSTLVANDNRLYVGVITLSIPNDGNSGAGSGLGGGGGYVP